jgi:hypothetical protein
LLHKFKKDAPFAVGPEKDSLIPLVWTWCGRQLSPERTTLAITGVSCVSCRIAFARYLAQLPDVERPGNDK